jgi:transposase
MRGLLGEYGAILPQGAWRLLAQAREAIADAELSDLARALFSDMLDELVSLDLRLDKLDRQFVAICRTNEACRRSRSCQASGRWSQQRSSPRLTTAAIFARGGSSRHGLALCLVNTRPAANPASAALAGAPIIIFGGR